MKQGGEGRRGTSVLPRLICLISLSHYSWSIDWFIDLSLLSSWRRPSLVFCLITHWDSRPPADICPPASSVCPSVLLLLPQTAAAAGGGGGQRGVRRGRQKLNTCVCVWVCACVCVYACEHSCDLNTGSLQVCIRIKPADTSNNSLINSHQCFFINKRLRVRIVSLWVQSAASVCRSTLQTGSNNTHCIFVSYGWCHHSLPPPLTSWCQIKHKLIINLWGPEPITQAPSLPRSETVALSTCGAEVSVHDSCTEAVCLLTVNTLLPETNTLQTRRAFMSPLQLSLAHLKRAGVNCVCMLCLLSVRQEVKEVIYMFPQGSTQWEVMEGLLIEKSHLQQKQQTVKEGGGETADGRASSQ